MKRQGSQLCLFTDKHVRRSFLCMVSRRPTRELLKKYRTENLHGIKVALEVESFAALTSSIAYGFRVASLELHFNNKHKQPIKRKGKYYYEE